MVREKGNWKRRKDSEFIVLRTLAMTANAIKSIEFQTKNEPVTHEAVPHSTLAKLLRELQNEKLIVKVDEHSLTTGRRDLKIPSFKISVLGLIRLFVLFDELGIEPSLTNVRKIMQNAQDLLGWVAVNWVFLATLYNERGMFNLLTSIAKTIKVIETGGVVLSRSTTGESVWTVIIGLKDDNREAFPCTSFKDAENMVLRTLPFWFVDGLIRFAVSTQSHYFNFEELKMLTDTSLTGLLNKLDSNLKLDYGQHIEMWIRRQEFKIQDMKKTLEILHS